MADLRCPHCGGGLELVEAGAVGSIEEELNIHESITVYAAEQRVTGRWSDQWGSAAESQLRSFERTGRRLERQEIAVYRDELLAQGNVPSTVNTHLSTLSGFCRWLVNRGQMAQNPVTGQLVRKSKSKATDEDRLAFEPEEVRALLAYVRENAPTVGHRALVEVMAYSGARNEEVAQLRMTDLRREEGIWVFDLATVDGGQKRKTAASRRLVPVHSQLLPLVQPLTAEPLQNLWGFKQVQGRWAYSASRWVNDKALKVLKGQGKVRDDRRLTLYSLRHAVATQLKHRDTPEALIAELVGHTNSSMTTGRYGKRYPVERLVEVVESIEW